MIKSYLKNKLVRNVIYYFITTILILVRGDIFYQYYKYIIVTYHFIMQKHN